ncbi:SigE family RNA polymerase sigma factor [Streptomyces sp. NBC_01764]|uniref:SigE family RNA polymerase sigma factor n=1 Tax=Streptomyces sp. NBC_01764 TaxID=2975935 RepID=UPI00225958B8|nr:SigE family RNA polymerase sigma factor [Streptomyces sp. NBC_01764]MCX4408454.1 SigE family RNA polymerase sigma factor [Streptomyces sp. NBC_01764]
MRQRAEVRNGEFVPYATTAWPRLVRAAHLLTGDLDEAEDLVRTALARVRARWRRIPRDDIDFYVRRSLVRTHLGRARRRRAARLLTALLPARARRAVPVTARPADRRDALGRALAALPARRRAVVVLRHGEGLSEAEIAQLLGCSPGTVKAHTRRGLAALRVHPSLAARLAASTAPSVAPSPARRHPVSGARS